jgi:signal-transduction protein with cAMP-binding, CBS, and nucleotidyltransferase domain
MQQID